ncbi:hypothetical protein M409DRAFT_21522 [Zasmidium cellare ATCC 36951]|uniref:Non-classical export protein 1 n=1 Tax=Zasmidium cellare ATCC 36951 TaxID=1080233 RepID=A0A6A6CLE2_ZASCE|nr:uncharacterized protein M409DRAFT_21522 [Zasmidium cellare ATCC 36951]KAF2168077.1 hypothetical protein M409DRAFT_21522 [Zasmidium cellare ATCC 36951]
MPAAYLISRTIDPIFAVSVGIVAAAVRINREEKERGKTTQETIDSLNRRTAMLFGNDTPATKAVEK